MLPSPPNLSRSLRRYTLQGWRFARPTPSTEGHPAMTLGSILWWSAELMSLQRHASKDSGSCPAMPCRYMPRAEACFAKTLGPSPQGEGRASPCLHQSQRHALPGVRTLLRGIILYIGKRDLRPSKKGKHPLLNLRELIFSNPLLRRCLQGYHERGVVVLDRRTNLRVGVSPPEFLAPVSFFIGPIAQDLLKGGTRPPSGHLAWC